MTGAGADEELEKTVITVMDEQIAQVSEITRKQDRAITDLAERMMEMTVEMKKLAEANGKRTFNGGGSSSFTNE